MSVLPASLAKLVDRPLAFFQECDRLGAIPMTREERARWKTLRAAARTVGLAGAERAEFILLNSRRCRKVVAYDKG